MRRTGLWDGKHGSLHVLDVKVCPYLDLSWVAMVTKGQRVIVLKEREEQIFGDMDKNLKSKSTTSTSDLHNSSFNLSR